MVIDANTGIAQKCFVGDDGYRRCNFVVRNGEPKWTKSGKWWRFYALPFPIFNKRKLPEEIKFSKGNFLGNPA